MSAYMQRQAELWQRRAWKAEDNLRCLLQELEAFHKKAREDLSESYDVLYQLTDLGKLAEIIEHYKLESKK